MNTITRSIASLALTALATASCSGVPTNPPAPGASRAPLRAASGLGRATDTYIVVFKAGTPDVRALSTSLVTMYGGSINYIYQHALRGFSATLSAGALDLIRLHPDVAYVKQVDLGRFRLDNHVTQSSATWGLDRVDQRARPLSGTYTYGETGSGVRVYIVDTGIRTTHNDFGGRASVFLDTRPQDGLNGQDCNGHGTHVAGTVGSTTYGVAKAVTLLAVRVNIACSDTVDDSALLNAIDSITGTPQRPAIANLSLGGPPDPTLDSAINNSIAAGVTYVVSAGNNNADACGQSPARVDSAITVAASNSSDARWVWNPFQGSNVGTCVDLFAPGENVTSLWSTSNTATNTITGTSMATPHVSGTAALYLQRDPTAVPSQVWSAISSRATANQLTNIGTGSPNLLLHSLFAEVTISGPASIQSCNTYTWAAAASGIGTIGYQWELYWHKYNVTENLGTEQTASRYLCPPTGLLTVRVTTTTNLGFHATAAKGVFGGF